MTEVKDSGKATQEAIRLKGEGKKLKEITATLGALGFRSSLGKPYSPSSVVAMMAKAKGGGKRKYTKKSARAMPALRAAASVAGTHQKSRNDNAAAYHAVFDSKELSDSIKIVLLRALRAFAA